MPKNEFTPWFLGSVRPVHEGVYERRGKSLGPGRPRADAADGYSHWNGLTWSVSMDRPNDVHLMRNSVSSYQADSSEGRDFEWRGLAEKTVED